MRVKGTMLLDYVKMVRANKDKKWDQYLKPEDWKIINEHILASNWYPLETFQRLGLAVFKEIAGSNLDTVRLFGRITMKNLLKIYKNILVAGDPVASIERLARLRATFIEGDGEGDTQVIASDDRSVRYKIFVPASARGTEYINAFCHQIAGNLEEIVEQAGGKKAALKLAWVPEGCEVSVRWK